MANGFGAKLQIQSINILDMAHQPFLHFKTMKELDEVELDRARCVAIVNQLHAPKVKEVPPPKVWVKEEIDTTDIEVKPKIIKSNEPKPEPKIQNTLF